MDPRTIVFKPANWFLVSCPCFASLSSQWCLQCCSHLLFPRKPPPRGPTQPHRESNCLSFNFASIAENMGAVGIRVEKPSELAGALQKDFAVARPVIVDVVLDIEALAPLEVM